MKEIGAYYCYYYYYYYYYFYYIIILIIVKNVFSAINCNLHFPRPGAIRWSRGTRGDLYVVDKI